MNNLSQKINTLSEPIIFTDDTNVVSGRNVDDFPSVSNIVLSHMSKWFTANKLTLNVDQVNIVNYIYEAGIASVSCIQKRMLYAGIKILQQFNM
jgi:hypothetical protein